MASACPCGVPLGTPHLLSSATCLPDRRSLRLPDMAPQTLDQSVEGDPAAWTVAQVLVHGDPGFQWQRELLRENAHDRLVATGNRSLADADAGTGSDQRQLSQVAVPTPASPKTGLANLRPRILSLPPPPPHPPPCSRGLLLPPPLAPYGTFAAPPFRPRAGTPELRFPFHRRSNPPFCWAGTVAHVCPPHERCNWAHPSRFFPAAGNTPAPPASSFLCLTTLTVPGVNGPPSPRPPPCAPRPAPPSPKKKASSGHLSFRHFGRSAQVPSPLCSSRSPPSTKGVNTSGTGNPSAGGPGAELRRSEIPAPIRTFRDT